MPRGYHPISLDQFTALMNAMEFKQRAMPGVRELVWERQVVSKSGRAYPYSVRIYSTIVGGGSRDVGEDAIRLQLIDNVQDRNFPQLDLRVFRTQNALPNVKERAKDLWRYVLNPDHECPKCKALMIERSGPKGRFLGCTHYPDCRGTRPLPSGELPHAKAG